jgi:hypothetical protein
VFTEETIKVYEVFVPVILALAGVWMMSQGAIVNSSAEVEGKSTPVWGVALYSFGGFAIVINLLLTLMVMVA